MGKEHSIRIKSVIMITIEADSRDEAISKAQVILEKCNEAENNILKEENGKVSWATLDMKHSDDIKGSVYDV